MSWIEHDEYIDLAKCQHVVVYRNRDTKAEHHLVHSFHLLACPSCGSVAADGQILDMNQKKTETLAALNSHYTKTLQYKEKHSRVRIGSEPKA